MEDSDPGRSRYVVVLRGPSGLHFGRPDGRLEFRDIPSSTGPVVLTYRTRRVRFDNFTATVRHGLLAEVKGEASSIRDATSAFANAANGFSAILSLSANVPVGPLEIELAYDATPGQREREFFQRFVPSEPLIPHPGRMVLARETGNVLLAIGNHEDADRIHRATVHYAEALRHWQPGHETFALAALWMGVESLTPVALRRELLRTGMTRKKLVESWGIELPQLDAEVRRRVLFRSDDQTYRAAKDTSDAFEHSYKQFTDVRKRAVEVRDTTGAYVRSAILDLADVDSATKQVLLAKPFDRAIWWTKEHYIFGKLVQPDTTIEDLARKDQEYPILNWVNTPKELSIDEFGDANLEFESTITPALAPGVGFLLDHMELWRPHIDELEEPGTSDSSETAVPTSSEISKTQ